MTLKKISGFRGFTRGFITGLATTPRGAYDPLVWGGAGKEVFLSPNILKHSAFHHNNSISETSPAWLNSAGLAKLLACKIFHPLPNGRVPLCAFDGMHWNWDHFDEIG